MSGPKRPPPQTQPDPLFHATVLLGPHRSPPTPSLPPLVTLPKPQEVSVFPASFAVSPPEFQPTAHIFWDQKVEAFTSKLPQYAEQRPRQAPKS